MMSFVIVLQENFLHHENENIMVDPKKDIKKGKNKATPFV